MQEINPYESPQVDPSELHDADDGNLEPLQSDGTSAGESLEPLHYALWLGCAVAIWWFPASYAFYLPSRIWGFSNLATDFLMAIIPAAGVASILLAAWRWHQGRRTFPAHFGHWLLLIFGSNWVAQRIMLRLEFQAIKMTLDPNPKDLVQDPEALLPVIGLTLSLAATTVSWLALRYSAGDKHWQRYALFALVSGCWNAIVTYRGLQGNWIVNWTTVLIVVFLGTTYVIAATRDLMRPRGRDQLHWVGVAWVPFLLLGWSASRFMLFLATPP